MKPLGSPPLWIAILEKGWAKANGSYASIADRSAHHTFRDLIGAPSFEHIIDFEEGPAQFIMIQEALEKDYLVYASPHDFMETTT